MINEFEFKGLWWLPEKPELQVSGTLKFKPIEGPVLELIGSLQDIHEFFARINPSIILGIASTGENITLYRCIEKQKNIGMPGFAISSFLAHKVFIGQHFTKPDDIKFKSLSVKYSYFHDWLGIHSFNIQYTQREEVTIKYKLPEPIQLFSNSNYKVQIEFRVMTPFVFMTQEEAAIRQETYLVIESTQEKPLDDLWRIFHIFNNFLTLACQEPIYPLFIEGTTEFSKREFEKKVFYEPIKIVYQLQEGALASITRQLSPYDILFKFKDIHNDVNNVLKNWYDKADILKPVYDLYFSTYYNPHMYAEHRFLSLVQALETYHRRAIRNQELPEGEHNERKKKIIDSVPDEYGDWLDKRLRYSNEPFLRDRLMEIMNNLTEDIEYISKLIPEKEPTVYKILNTRNYLTHYDDSLKNNAATGKDLYYLTQKLKVFIEACLLKEMGFTKEEINRMFSSNRNYKWLLNPFFL